jgi:peptidoglycan/LPS O-acetylase OafA/YrhL
MAHPLSPARDRQESHHAAGPVAGAVAPVDGAAVEAERPQRASHRLPGIDGLRAVAALWVVLFHVHAFSQARFAHVPGLDLIMRSGSTGVSLFLVLSGFCLYLPFAGGRTGRFRTREFMLRRCRRLLPAYYTSLAVFVAINVGAAAWLGLAPLSTGQAIWQALTHVALIHTLFPSTFYSLNGAYWSLGLEWQLYLALPLLVWGIGRFGLRRTALAAILCNIVYRLLLAVATGKGVIPAASPLALVVLPNQLPGRWAEFVFGMIVAELYVTGQIARWAGTMKVACLVLIPASLVASGSPLSHLLFGGVFFILVSLVLTSGSLAGRIFSWPPLVAIGTMSYSLYLVHQPLVQGFAHLVQVHGHASPNRTFLALLLFLPAILFAAWALFVGVERHSLTAAPANRSHMRPIRTAQRRHALLARTPEPEGTPAPD